MSAVHSHCKAASAAGPVRRYLENEVWSKTATASRVARCSAADQGSQFGLSHEYSMTGCSPSAGGPGGGPPPASTRAETFAPPPPLLGPKPPPPPPAR